MRFTEKEKKRLKQKYGDWAIVTGATSGIGLELTERLAEAGFNIIINARNKNRLEEIRQQLESNYSSKIIVVAADCGEPEGIRKIINAEKDKNTGLVAVCAGYGSSGLFIESNLPNEIGMLRVNCEGILQLTHYFSKQFAKKKRGGIVLMSSLVAFQGVPYAAHYAATKANVQSLGEALAIELKPYGVDVLSAAPGPVRSGFEMRANMKMNMSLTTAEVGIPILEALGRKHTVLPGFLSKFLVWSLRTVPRWGKILIMKKVMGGMTKHQRL
jgi:short-subunit dehydrogenase